MASPYHLNMGNVSRGNGDSVVAGAAYRAGEKILDQRTGLTHDYSRRDDILYSAIFAPKNAPEWAQDRGELWNHVEEFENAKNSRLAKTITAALPWQLDEKHREYMVKDFAYDLTRKGLIVDVNIHDAHEGGSNKNIHAHIFITTRTIDENDFSKGKLLELDKVETLRHFRDRWAEIGARQLEKTGYVLEAEQWRHGQETMEQQKAAALERGDLEFAATCNRPATQHMGRAALEIEARGEHSDRAQTIRDRQELRADERELVTAQAELGQVEEQKRYIVEQREKYEVRQQPNRHREFAELREWAQEAKEQWDKEREAQQQTAAEVREVRKSPSLEPMHPADHKRRIEERAEREQILESAKAEITQPIQMTPESIDLAGKQAIEQWERSQEQGLEYGLGLGLEL
jgi:MobA/MobL family